MAETSKYRNLYDVALYGIPLLLIAVGIYFIRSPRVGVLNLDRVAQEIGVLDRIKEGERKWMGAAYTELNELTERNRAQLAILESKLEKTSDESSKKAVREQMQRLQVEVQSAAERTRQEFQMYREGVRRQIRARIDPVVSEIARKRRYDVVIDSSEGKVVSFSRSAVDITQDVINGSRSVVSNADLGISAVPGRPSTLQPVEAKRPAGVNAKKK